MMTSNPLDTLTPPGSIPSSPMGFHSHFGGFPFSPLTPDSEASPIRPSYSGALMRDNRARQQLFHPSPSQVEQDLLAGRDLLLKWCISLNIYIDSLILYNV